MAQREPGELRGDLVERGEDEAVELDLDDRPVAAHREADRGADDARLGERGVEYALVAELGREPLGHAEHAAERTDVLAHEQHLVVGAHRVAEAGGDRLRHRQGLHAAALGLGDGCLGGRRGNGLGRCGIRDRDLLLVVGACAHAAPPSKPDS
ncbi:hypothetical protein QFZ26_001579 [Agromyces ramosus]|uniref:Uncharacterized protein n=1 Tax=Agromyces ramosus TaxID=33879 RepID=A0ABU0RAF6_9MICO|nr:hypothetical protein [Agromyces ramosus]